MGEWMRDAASATAAFAPKLIEERYSRQGLDLLILPSLKINRHSLYLTHSYRRALTGSVLAALRAWKLTVNRAMERARTPDAKKIHMVTFVR